MIIYKVTNLLNGKVYIGQSKNSLEVRRQQHIDFARSGGDTHFCQAIRKYGEDNFQFEVICSVESRDEAIRLENFYIHLYDSIKKGYNMVDFGTVNVMDSPDIKSKHDTIMRSDSVRKKISDSMKAYRRKKPFTEEHRQKISAAMKGNHNFGNPDTRSVPCYCIIDGVEHHFHNYLQAGIWWHENYHPFPYSMSQYQCKIQQSIREGYATYGRGKNKKQLEYIQWYLEEVVK